MKDALNEVLKADISALLPQLNAFLGWMKFLLAVLMLLAPVLLLVSGIRWYYKPEPQATYKKGYRTYYGMGSTRAWAYAQRYAGKTFCRFGIFATGIAAVIAIVTAFFSGLVMAVAAVLCLLAELIAVIVIKKQVDANISAHFDKDGNPR